MVQQTSLPWYDLQELRFSLCQGLKFVTAATCASNRSVADKPWSQRDILGGHQQKTELDRAHLLLSLMPEKCFTLERDVFLCWVNIQSIGSLRSMAYFTDNSYLLWTGQWVQINGVRLNQKQWSPLQSVSGIYRWNKLIQIVPHGRPEECRINVINGLWYIITGADEGWNMVDHLNCSEMRKFSPRSNVRQTETELSTIWQKLFWLLES